jgi:short subunit dehydrogenase-like uncharacterized protein
LTEIDPALAEMPLIRAEAGDRLSMRALAESSKVVISTVGPYSHYGEPIVAACAAAGTDYVDLTGEPEFVDRMWIGYHAQAERTGARLVHSCGFDSIPYDLGVLFTVDQMPENVGLKIQGFVRTNGTISGGTFHSAVHILSRVRQAAQVARERRELEGDPPGRQIHGPLGRPHDVPTAGGWVVPLPTIDPQNVLSSARKLDRYGPDFTYEHYLVVKHVALVGGFAVAAGLGVALTQLPPTRDLLLKVMDPGDGPSAEQRAKGSFNIRFHAEGGGKRLATEVSGGDPGYSETAKMLGESALCLARDELPERAGQLTPAVAMGQALIDRLQAVEINFAVVEGQR